MLVLMESPGLAVTVLRLCSSRQWPTSCAPVGHRQFSRHGSLPRSTPARCLIAEECVSLHSWGPLASAVRGTSMISGGAWDQLAQPLDPRTSAAGSICPPNNLLLPPQPLGLRCNGTEAPLGQSSNRKSIVRFRFLFRSRNDSPIRDVVRYPVFRESEAISKR